MGGGLGGGGGGADAGGVGVGGTGWFTGVAAGTASADFWMEDFARFDFLAISWRA